jgi:hypothetical protein
VTIRSESSVSDSSAFRSVVFPEPVAPDIATLRLAATASVRSRACALLSISRVGEVLKRHLLLREAPDRHGRAVGRQRRHHHVHARPIGQPSIGDRMREIRARSGRPREPLDEEAQLVFIGESHISTFESAGPLDPDLPRAIDEYVGHMGISHQRAEWPVAVDVIDDEGHPVPQVAIVPGLCSKQ